MKPLLCLLLTLCVFAAKANDSISIKINKLKFSPGDTIHFSCTVANYRTLGLEFATMNIWIEDVNRTTFWKFRYPMLNGELPKTKLIISDSLKQGFYSINFLIQKGLFSLSGKVKDNYQSMLNYLVLTKDGKSHINKTTLTKQGQFVIPNIVFDGEASIIFSPVKAKMENDLYIDVVSPLDSAFVPEAVLSQVIRIGDEPGNPAAENAFAYEFNWDEAQIKGMLPPVVVTAKQKKKAEQFNEEFATPFFRQDDNAARIFNGFEDPQLSRGVNLENFLVSRVPGFQRVRDFNTNIYEHRLRTDIAVVYLNEMPVPGEFDINSINQTEIAIIKVINSPTMINRMGNGAAILIYTKRGSYYRDGFVKHNFVFKGYTPQESTWK